MAQGPFGRLGTGTLLILSAMRCTDQTDPAPMKVLFEPGMELIEAVRTALAAKSLRIGPSSNMCQPLVGCAASASGNEDRLQRRRPGPPRVGAPRVGF